MTLTSYLKSPTASKREGLGTGEWDGGPGLGFAKKIIASIKAIADASYYFNGKVSGQGTLDQTNLDAGLEYDITTKTAATVKYEYSTASSKGTGAQSEDIAFSLEYELQQ